RPRVALRRRDPAVRRRRDRLDRVLRGARRSRPDERRTTPCPPRSPRRRRLGAGGRSRVRPQPSPEPVEGPASRRRGGVMATPDASTSSASGAAETWPLWEVFVRANRGLSHVHVGSLHAPDAELAVRNARDLYTRRGEGTSIWVVPA